MTMSTNSFSDNFDFLSNLLEAKGYKDRKLYFSKYSIVGKTKDKKRFKFVVTTQLKENYQVIDKRLCMLFTSKKGSQYFMASRKEWQERPEAADEVKDE